MRITNAKTYVRQNAVCWHGDWISGQRVSLWFYLEKAGTRGGQYRIYDHQWQDSDLHWDGRGIAPIITRPWSDKETVLDAIRTVELDWELWYSEEMRGRGKEQTKLKHVVFKLEIGDPDKAFLPDTKERPIELVKGWGPVQKVVAREASANILRTLSRLPANTVLEIDFDALEYIDRVCANQVVVFILKPLKSGQYPDRFILLCNVKQRYVNNIGLVLEGAQQAAIMTAKAGHCGIIGCLTLSYRAALLAVMEMGSATARELKQAMSYKTVNEASTKVSTLYQCRLLAREAETGKRYRYISLLQAAGGKEEVST